MSTVSSAEPVLLGPRLVVDLGRLHPCLSSAVLGGGLGRMRTWLNLQVPPDYGRTDPWVHLAEEASDLAGPVVGMMTAAPVAAYADVRTGLCRAVATAGVRHAMAAAGTRPRPVAPPEDAGGGAGTINLLVVLDVPLSAPGLVNALATAVEAKAQALAAARIRARNADGYATGTATDAICVACPPGAGSAFAGPATRVGADTARAVYEAVLAGIASRRHMGNGPDSDRLPGEAELPRAGRPKKGLPAGVKLPRTGWAQVAGASSGIQPFAP